MWEATVNQVWTSKLETPQWSFWCIYLEKPRRLTRCSSLTLDISFWLWLNVAFNRQSQLLFRPEFCRNSGWNSWRILMQSAKLRLKKFQNFICFFNISVFCLLAMGWRHFVDNDISWTLFFKMGDFSWTFPKGDFSWTLLVTSRGQF